MRIVGGTVKGFILKMPKGGKTRPAMSKVKESVFSILSVRLPEARVLDLFAGSGSVGIEALSRGAGFAVFVDNSGECAKVIKENLEKTGFVHKAEVYREDCITFFRRHVFDPFDLVFIDPPYLKGFLDPLLEIIPDCQSFDDRTIFIIEREKSDDLKMGKRPDLIVVDERSYGATIITLFKRKPGEKAQNAG